MKTLLLMVLLSGQAMACSDFTVCNNQRDYYMPENLIRIARASEEDSIDRFFKRLGCWSGGDDYYGQIVCRTDGEDAIYAWKRDPEIKTNGVILFLQDPRAGRFIGR